MFFQYADKAICECIQIGTIRSCANSKQKFTIAIYLRCTQQQKSLCEFGWFEWLIFRIILLVRPSDERESISTAMIQNRRHLKRSYPFRAKCQHISPPCARINHLFWIFFPIFKTTIIHQSTIIETLMVIKRENSMSLI